MPRAVVPSSISVVSSFFRAVFSSPLASGPCVPYLRYREVYGSVLLLLPRCTTDPSPLPCLWLHLARWRIASCRCPYDQLLRAANDFRRVILLSQMCPNSLGGRVKGAGDLMYATSRRFLGASPPRRNAPAPGGHHTGSTRRRDVPSIKLAVTDICRSRARRGEHKDGMPRFSTPTARSATQEPSQ